MNPDEGGVRLSSLERADHLVAVLAHRADPHPDRRAFTFLDGDVEAGRLSYGELDRRARATAVALRTADAAPGDPRAARLSAGPRLRQTADRRPPTWT